MSTVRSSLTALSACFQIAPEPLEIENRDRQVESVLAMLFWVLAKWILQID